MHAEERKRSEPTLASAIDEYADYLRHEQHASATTQRGYRSNLRRFVRFIAARYPQEPAVCDITIADIRDFLYSLSRKGLRPRTLCGMLYPLRNMLALAVERGYRGDNPALAVRLPQKDAAIRMTVREEELTQLFVGVERERDPEERAMNRAILSVLVHTAVRRQELLGLDIGDVDLAEKRLTVRSGKGSKRRTVPLSQPCHDALKEWLDVRRPMGCKHNALFVADRRRRLGDIGLSNIIEKIRAMADLRDADHITPHAIRHAAATRMLKKGGDLRSIQQILGHSSLQTTAVYLHTDEAQMKRVVDLAALDKADTAKAEKEEKRRAKTGAHTRRTSHRVERRRR
jgi:integrase/recombinase XerC